MYVINPLDKTELEKFFDKQSLEVIKYFIVKSIVAQPELLPNQKTLPIHIPKEHLEQWFTQALDVESIGGGSYPIDIYNNTDKWGADIKMLAVKLDRNGNIRAGADSGEASLGQNFKDAGQDLDSLFKDKEYDQIKDLWLDLYNKKYETVKEKYDVKDFYYFFVLRSGSSFYIVSAKINLLNIKNTVVVPISEKGKKISSVFLKNFIDDSFGNAKIYKSKKRLELRLKPKKWIDAGYAIKFETNFKPVESILREELSDKDYMNKIFEYTKQLEIKIS